MKHCLKGLQQLLSSKWIRHTGRVRLIGQPIGLQQSTSYSETASSPAIDKALLSKLRKQTGFAFINCRKALALHNNDFDQALEWLQAEAAQAGWDKATKLADRPMSQGVIGLVNRNNKCLLLEVNCETDFVARNLKFLELVSNVTNICFDHMQQSSEQRKLDVNENALTNLTDNAGQTIADIVAKEVGNIGENIKASRAVCLSSAGEHEHIAHYLHNAGLNEKYLEIEDCQFGKYAGLALLQGLAPGIEIKEHGTQLCQHIVGMNPSCIDRTEEGDSDTPVTQSEGDNSTDTSNEEEEKVDREEKRLLYQEFLLDPDVKVKEWLKDTQLQVNDFVRYGVGEMAKW